MNKGENKQVIGFDLDNVFLSYPPLVPKEIIDFLYKRSFSFNKQDKNSNTLSYRFPGKFEQKIRIFSHLPIFRHPIKENIETLANIYKKNYSLYLVSSRFSFLKIKTENILNRYQLSKYFTKTCFNFDDLQPHIFKDKIIKKLSIEKFIDDDLDLLTYLAPRNPKINFFWISKKGTRKMLAKNIVHIYDLKEFEKNYL